MKKTNLSLTTLYFFLTIVAVVTVLIPLLFWSYSDFKEKLQTNLNNLFVQTKNLSNVIISNRYDNLENRLISIEKIDPRKNEKELDKVNLDNVDILFYKYRDGEVINLSTALLYDTKSIVNELIDNKYEKESLIVTLQLQDKYISLLYVNKKIIDENTGRVIGTVGVAEILNDNLSLFNSILDKTSLQSVSLVKGKHLIVSTIKKDSIEYENLNKIDNSSTLHEYNNLIYYKDIYNCKKSCTDIHIIFSIDNSSLKLMYKKFQAKLFLIAILFMMISFFGYFMTKRFLINPIYRLIEFADKENVKGKFTFIKEVNVIANNLNKTITSLNEYKKAVDVSSIVSKADINGKITFVNDMFCVETGYSKEELIGKPHNILRDPSVPKSVFEEMWYTIKTNKKPWTGYLSNKKKNGKLFYIKLTITPILDENENIVEFLALRENITELEESKKILENIYITDKLTKLYNRYKLTSDLKEHEDLNLILFNIDSFSEINDFYGNKIGDTVLVEFSLKIIEFFKNKSFDIYRVYGDEFAVTINNLDIETIEILTNNFLNEISEVKFNIDGFRLNIRVTAGICEFKYENIFVSADLALKSAKRSNKDCEIFNIDNPIVQEHENNLLWTQKIKEALLEDRIVPFFQPIRNNRTQKIDKYECLVRLIEKDGKVVSPFFFLDIAKKSKLYNQITKKVIEKSFDYFKDCDIEFSVNLTIDDILNEDTVKFIEEQLLIYNISHRVVFEIVESEQIEDFEKISEFINKFKSYGCKMAIDDFGTGYSNFEYLIKLNIDYLKIDGSLIKNIVNDKNIFSVVETIVGFANKSNLKVIAEFIASEDIQKSIIDLDINYSQGYYFGEPKDKII